MFPWQFPADSNDVNQNPSERSAVTKLENQFSKAEKRADLLVLVLEALFWLP